MANQIYIDPLSLCSLFLHVRHDAINIGQATGFTIKIGDSFFLVTNKHVVTFQDKGSGRKTNNINIIHHSSTKLGTWITKNIFLFDDDGKKLWYEHTNPSVDVVLIKIMEEIDIKIYPLDINLAETDMRAVPGMPVSIIGYPKGIVTGGNFPIWKTGHIASDPDLDFSYLPAFLIDATTREGMSGSPTLVRQNNFLNKKGQQTITAGFETLFMGIYSGRIKEDTEIGIIWRPSCINEILKTIH